MNWDLLIQLLVNGLIVGMLYGVVAMCFTLIYKSTQVVNFAQGEFLVLGAWICWYFIVKWQLPFVAAFAFALVFTTLFGILVQVVLLRPLVGEPIISVIMVTIGLAIFMQAVMNWASATMPPGSRTSSAPRRSPSPVSTSRPPIS
jgi:branched-chain amino acid transport system permease protein